MSRYCPKCGKEHIRNEEYCLDCHTKLPKEEIELNDKNPGSIFRNEKIKNEKIQTVKKNTGLGKIFTYEKAQNIPNEVKQTPKIERTAKPKNTQERSKTLNIFKRKPKEQKTNIKQNNEKKPQSNTQTEKSKTNLKPQTNTKTQKPQTNTQTQKPQTNTKTQKPQTNTQTQKPQTNTQTQKPQTNKENFEKVKTPNNAKGEKPKDTHERSITPNIFKRKPKEQKTNIKQNNEKKPQKPQTQKPQTNKGNFEKVKTPNNTKGEKPKDAHELSKVLNIFKRKPKEQKEKIKQNNEKKTEKARQIQTEKPKQTKTEQKPKTNKEKPKQTKTEQKPKINKNKQKPIEVKTPQGKVKTKAKESKSFSISEEGKRKIIIGGLIVLAILIIIIIAGVLTNPALNSNETGHTNYNFTDFVVSIPNDYKQNNDTDFVTEFTKDNVTVKFYTSNLYGTGYQGTSIEGLQQATVNNIVNNLNGTISYNDLTYLDNDYRGYNITYSSGGNVTRDIGFVKDNVEYDIIITTPGNNTEKLDNVSSEIIPTLKITE